MRKLFIALTFLLTYVVCIAQTFEVNGLYYEIVNSLDKTVGVTINPNKYQHASYEIPEKVAYNGVEYSVTSIEGPAFRSCSNLISITIPNSVNSIGNAAFMSCKSLSSVNIPKSVTNIGEYTFYGCSNLTSITIPNSVTSIGSFAFQLCSGLMSVTIPNSVTSIGSNAFDSSGLRKVNISDIDAWCKISFGDIDANPLYYAHHLYVNNNEVTNLVIPDGTVSIEKSAFAGCSGLTSVTIPNSVTNIGDFAFYECSNLTSITIPNSVTNIAKSAFRECKIRNLNIDNNRYCSKSYFGTSLEEVVIGEHVTNIEKSAFQDCSNLISVTIPNSVTSIGGSAFYGCSGLKKVNISDIAEWCKISFDDGWANPLYYAHHLYVNDEEIINLVIPNSVARIGFLAFYNCTNLRSVTIPSSVTGIGNYAFYNCSGLTSAIIPNSVTNIGEVAFVECKGLKDVYNKASTPQSNSGSIPKSCRIHVKEGLEGIYKATSAWGNYTIVDDITRLNLTKITLDKEQIYCKVYDKAKLDFVFEPADADNPTVNFSSSDPSIVMVVGNDGQLLALKEGKAIIIATAADGSGVTAICEVIVGPEPYFMNVSTSANGSIIYGSAIITNESKSFQITEDDEITLTIIPKNDYRLVSLIVNGKNVTADVKNNTYTIGNFTSDVSVFAVFEEIPYELEDVNRDGLINAADVVQIYNKIIEG